MKPYLYSLVDENILRDMLQSFQGCIDIPLQVTDEAGNTLMTQGEQARYCHRFSSLLPHGEGCIKLHMDAARRAVGLGEAYMFSCHANLNHMVYPLLCDGAFWGAVLAGPFLLDKPDSTIIAEVSKRYSIDAGTLLELYDDLSGIRVITPAAATHISKQLYYLFSSLIATVFIVINLTRPEIHSKALMPALQSYYFVPHVTVYILSYAMLGVSAITFALMLIVVELQKKFARI